jgi:ketopantoate reductase
MRYAVVGIGAVGCVISGLLIRSQADVTLIGKQHQVDVIKKTVWS